MLKKKEVFSKTKNVNRFNLLIYLLLVIGVFLLLYRFPLRIDFTSNQNFTLSDASKNLVRGLNDPVRIKVFISDNLPPPLNDMEISLRDVLEEYNGVGGDKFTYVFYNIDEKKESESLEVRENLELASQYGIAPQQIQSFDKDEVKLVKVYLGLVLEYGDSIEKIPFVTSSDSLEYQITEIINNLTRKNDKILGLTSNIEVTLYLNDEFVTLGRYFGIDGLGEVSELVTKAIDEVKRDNFNKVDFAIKSSITPADTTLLNADRVRRYPWPAFSIENGGDFSAGVGYAAITVRLEDKVGVIELLRPETRLQLTGQGLEQVATYVLIDLNEGLQEEVNGTIETILEVNQKIAYLSSKGTVELTRSGAPNTPAFLGGNQQAEGANFYNALARTYSVEEIDLKDLTDKYNSLIIAGASEEFSDHDLFVIDQFLMKGKSIIVFQDSFINEGQNLPFQQNQPPRFVENKNRLNELLEHYGLNQGKSIVLDKKSFLSRQQNPNGAVQELKIYFAPIVQNIDNDFAVLANVKQFITLQNSPLSLNEENLKKHENVETYSLYSSSVDSWLMKDNIVLIPQALIPPADEASYRAESLAYLVEGEFESFFKDKPIPPRQENEEDGSEASAGDLAENGEPQGAQAGLAQDEIQEIVERGERGRILLISSSQVIKNNIFGGEAQLANSIYILNLVDYLNNREDWGIMRSKRQYFNPLEDFDEKATFFKRFLTNRDLIKFFNIVGLPLFVAVFGFAAFSLRKVKKNRLASAQQSKAKQSE